MTAGRIRSLDFRLEPGLVEQVSHALANGYFVGTINRVGKEPLVHHVDRWARPVFPVVFAVLFVLAWWG